VRPHSAAVTMSMTGGRIDSVRTSDGETVRTDAVVNCAGPGAGEVAALAGVELPMRNTAGLLAYTAPTAVTVGRVIHAPQIHLRPDGGGRMVLASVTPDAAVSTHDDGSRIPEPGAAQAILHRADELYPELRGSKVEASRIGVRPIPIDGLPVLGRSSTQEPYMRKPRDAAGSGVQQRHEALPVPIAAAYSGVADLPTIHSSVRTRPPRGYGEQSVASAAAGQAIQATSCVMVRAH
jgi:glycine/D-amino acid oxidase-like deaminating enzyme